MNIQIKPETALIILKKMLRRVRDTWEHDALAYAIKLIEERLNEKQ